VRTLSELWQRNNRGSSAETFRSMIEASGLPIRFVYGCAPQRMPDDRKYYIGITRRDDAAPDWVVRLAHRSAITVSS